MSTVISVENLSKKYIIGHQKQARHSTLRDVLADSAKQLTNKLRHPFAAPADDPTHEEFWALNDVSFDIKQGDRVGIIGRNGAGKSTLLKILSRITEPTSGKISIKGRVASLLEVGTGFHPELSGRENIYLNGAILGMSKAEIKNKFDEIVAFAEVERFLDTPVKRYSSGMYVRLAFAVAAHLEPEILIVDEVLAVGDAQFQKKCMGKMESVSSEGRTILFVSHNIGSVRNLCNRAILLQQGSLIADDTVEPIIQCYFGSATPSSHIYLAEQAQSQPYIKKVEVSQDGKHGDSFNIDKPIKFLFELVRHNVSDLEVGLQVNNIQGVCAHHSSSAFVVAHSNTRESTIECLIPAYGLAQGKYSINFSLGKRNYQLFEKTENAIVFEVEFTGKLSDKTTASQWQGICGPGLLLWR